MKPKGVLSVHSGQRFFSGVASGSLVGEPLGPRRGALFSGSQTGSAAEREGRQ